MPFQAFKAAQGVLAVQGRVDAAPELFDGFADADVATAVLAERAFVARLDGGCSSPIAAHAKLDGDSIELRGLYYDEENQQARRGCVRGAAADAVALACDLADRLLAGEGEML